MNAEERESILTPVNEDANTEEAKTEAEKPQTAIADNFETENAENEATDYGELLKSDMLEISSEFSPEKEIKISELKNPLRYGALRDLGLTPKEAYLASGGKKEAEDNRAHLSSSVPRKISSLFSEMPRAEFDAAREIFGDMSDSEIRNLYKKVSQ